MATRVESVAAGVVLAGGRSARMGTPKAALEWHGSTVLRRTPCVLARAADGPVLAFRAPGPLLPENPLRRNGGPPDDASGSRPAPKLHK